MMDPRYKIATHHAHNALDEVAMLATNDYCDLFHHYHSRKKYYMQSVFFSAIN